MTQAIKVRLRFGKRGDLRLISHHDLLRCLERMLRRARAPIALTGGFNPRPKITFALALALGVQAEREVVDLELSEPWGPSTLLERLRAAAPPGFDWLEARLLPPNAGPPRPRSLLYELSVPPERRAAASAALQTLLNATAWPKAQRKKNKERTFDLRPHLIEAAITDAGTLRFRLAVAPEGAARPEDVLEAIELLDLIEQGAVLVRADMELEPEPEPGGCPEIVPNEIAEHSESAGTLPARSASE